MAWSGSWVPQFLQNISNQGTGRSYQEFIRDFYVTPYIKNLTENSFNILTLSDLGREPQYHAKYEALEQLVQNASNTPLVIDTYPFTNPNWNSANMSRSAENAGELVYNTTKVLKVFKAMSPEDGIIVKKDEDNIELSDGDDANRFCWNWNNWPIF